MSQFYFSMLRFTIGAQKDYISQMQQCYEILKLLPYEAFQNKTNVSSATSYLCEKVHGFYIGLLFWSRGHSSQSRRSLVEAATAQDRGRVSLVSTVDAMRLRLAGAVLLSAAAYYVYLPLPSGVSEPWKLMMLDALFRSFMQAVRADWWHWQEGRRGQVDVRKGRAVRITTPEAQNRASEQVIWESGFILLQIRASAERRKLLVKMKACFSMTNEPK